MMREVIHAAKAMLNEGGRPLNDRVVVLPAVQGALNTAWQKRLQATPYHVMMGRDLRTAFSALIEGADESLQFSPIDEDRLKQLVDSLVDTQEGPGRGAATRRRRSSSPPRARRSRQDSAAFLGRRLRLGGSSIQAGH